MRAGTMDAALHDYGLERIAVDGAAAVVIGASAGGIDALLTILSGLPAELPFPVIVVLHLTAGRDSRLPELFRQYVALPVCEAEDKAAIVPGTLYFAGSGYHLSIESDRSFSLSVEERVHYSRPSIDVLMESAAHCYGPGLLGIVLTGANQDGAQGLLDVKRGGGTTVVQDPVEAQSPAMPLAAIAQCAPDRVLPLQAIRALLNNLKGR